MRRLFLACTLLFLMVASLCHLQVLGFILKTVTKWSVHSLLAYRALHWEGGELILEDAVLFDIQGSKSSYFLRSEEISLTMGLSWPLSLGVHVKKPHIVISPQHVEWPSAQPSKAIIHWSIELEKGFLEWSENQTLKSQFSLSLSSDHRLSMEMVWDKGMLAVEKKEEICQVSWEEMPLDVVAKYIALSGFAFPVSTLQGILSGSMVIDEEGRIEFRGQAENIWFEWEKIGCNSSLLCEGVWKKEGFERVRISLLNGKVLSDFSEIKNIEACMTYRSNLGMKCEGHGTIKKHSLEMPLEWEAKSYFAQKTFDWASAALHLGQLEGHFSWNETEKIFAWEGLGKEESSLLQGLVSPFIPGIEDWRLLSGILRGSISFENFFTPHLISFEAKDVELTMGSFGFVADYFAKRGEDWNIESFRMVHDRQNLLQGNGRWCAKPMDQSPEKGFLEGYLGGIQFAGNWQWDGKNFTLSIPQIEGAIPPCICPTISGKMVAEEGGFQCTGSWAGIESWRLSYRIVEGAALMPYCNLSDIECSVIVDPHSIDFFSVRGHCSLLLDELRFETSFFAPRVEWKEEESTFDLRFYRESIDFLRLKGTQVGGSFQLDPHSSHLFGEPLLLQKGVWEEGHLSSLSLETELNPPFINSFCQGLIPLNKVHLSALWQQERGTLALTSSNWMIQIEHKENQWNCHGSFNSILFDGLLSYQNKRMVMDGHLLSPGLSFDFEGMVNQWLEGNLILRNIEAQTDHPFFALPFQGSVDGQAQVRFNRKEIETDLDLQVKDIFYRGFSLENRGPLHIYYSSHQGVVIKGVDCRIQKDNLEGHAKIDLVHFDQSQNRWNVQKAKTHIPSEWLEYSLLDQEGELICALDFSCAADFSDWSCSAKKVLLPMGGSMLHFQNLQATSIGSTLSAEAFLSNKEKSAKISFQMQQGEILSGKLCLEELNQTERPMLVSWSFQEEVGLLVHSIEGGFGGIEATFHALEPGHLLGNCRLDFRRLSEWIPNHVAKSFRELKMGKGYELKGNLQIDPKAILTLSFQGIFSGKQIELAGFQLRTLLGHADLHLSFSNTNQDPSWVHIEHLKISDSACILKINRLWIRGDYMQPWTIEMPELTIEELRPSLLVKPGSVRGPISPLLVRQLKMVNFCGLLDDGKTYSAEGELSFINSFKREQTVFDLPANVFGRIIGLDLELLIPVKGELTFTLKDGLFHLKALKHAYSEGGRSEFFLVQSEASEPCMDLDGNLQILVKMKQFVLFSLTEAFMISIDGKLNDPNFRLQKKKRFL